MINKEWLTKKRGKRVIPVHYGMPDYYNYFTKKHPDIKISRTKFNKIITEYASVLREHLIQELTYKLPFRLGDINILKQERDMFIDDKTGKVINTNPPDWEATLNLWSKNEEAKEKKIIIRHNNKHTGGYVFRIMYNKDDAYYKNQRGYYFKAIRSLKRSVAKRINDYSKEKYDTYITK